MKYNHPHLSPELRAQITPTHKRDRKYAYAGGFFLALSGLLLFNLWPKGNELALSNNKSETLTAQSNLNQEDKQILGLASTEEQPKEDFTLYAVKGGDTLFNISQQYNIKWDLIAQLNGLQEPFLLKAGQQLKIPQATTSQIPNKIYTIQANDTLASIARRFNITVDDIIAVNPNLQKSDLITVGQIIKLP